MKILNYTEFIAEEIQTKELGEVGTDTAGFIIIDPARLDNKENAKNGLETPSFGGDGGYKVSAEYDSELEHPHIPTKIIIQVREAIERLYELEKSDWLVTGKKLKTVWDGDSPISYNVDDKMRIDDTSKYKVLYFIWDSGETGRGYTEIVKYIVEDLKGIKKYDWRKHRGYWATNLLGAGWGGPEGILKTYCEKNNANKWIVTNKKLKDHFRLKGLRGALSDVNIGELV